MPSDRIGRKSEHIPDQRKRVISRNEGAYYAADRRVVSMYMSLVYSESSTLSGLACEVAKEWKKKKKISIGWKSYSREMKQGRVRLKAGGLMAIGEEGLPDSPPARRVP